MGKYLNALQFLVLFLACGVFANAAVVRGAVTGTAEAQGMISTILIPQDKLLPLLPKGARIERFPNLPENLHPVVMYIGQHGDLMALTSDRKIPLVKKYNEFTFGIPNVFIPGHAKPFVHLPLLRVDSRRALMAGWLYGFPKKMAHFVWNDEKLSVYRKNEELLNFEFSVPRTYDPQKFTQQFSRLQSEMRPLLVIKNGQFRCIDFNWNFNVRNARPLAVKMNLKIPQLGLAAGSYESPSLDLTHLGTVFVKTQWTMSEPHECPK